MKRRICFISLKAYTLFRKEVPEIIGGSQAAFYFLASEIVKNCPDAEISFIVADYGQAEIEVVSGIRIIRSCGLQDSGLRKIARLIRAIIIANADTYVYRTLIPMAGPLALFVKMLGKKFVYMVACDHEVDGRYEHSYASPLSAFFAHLVFSQAQCVIVQHSVQHEFLARRWGRNAPILKSGIVINDFDKKDDGSILWVARSIPTKRPFMFFALAKHNPSIRFIMISAGFDDKNKFHAEVAERARAVPNLKFINYVHFNDIFRYYQNARVFVNTSSMEGLPFSFVQAMAAKTPIVSLEIDPDNMFDIEECGFCCKGDVKMLERKVLELYNDQGLFRKMSDNAFRAARNNHDTVSITESFLDIIK